jgi:tRNA-dihydrouridine synthase
MRKAVGKPVSVKIRMGGLEETVRLCARLGEEGADSIIIHARAPEQPYCEKADWDFIRMLRQRVDVPLVGNGDIGSASEGRRLVSEGYCDSFMVGRAAMANPMLFSDRRPQTIGERFALLEEYAAIHRELKGEPALNDIRAKAIHLMNGLRDASVFRGRISSAVSADEILSLEEEMEKSRIS